MKKVLSIILVITLSLNAMPVYADTKLDKLKEVSGSITEKAGDAASAAAEQAGNLKDKASDTAGNVMEKAKGLKDVAVDTAGNAKDVTAAGAEKAKDAAAVGAEKVKDAATAGTEKAKEAAKTAGEYVGEKAEAAGAAVSSGAKTVAAGAQELFSKIDPSKFKSGWDYVVKHSIALRAAGMTEQNLIEVEEEVIKAIQRLENNINQSAASSRNLTQEKGFVFETWHADTFNINAAANRSKERAWRPESNESGSVDVQTSSGGAASMKAYKDGKSSGFEQAKRADAANTQLLEGWRKYNSDQSGKQISFRDYVDTQLSQEEINDLFIAKYSGQTRIIPEDHMKDAVDYLTGRTDKLKTLDDSYSKAQRKVYEDTLKNLKDHIEAPDGTKSKALNSEDLQTMTELADKGEFKAEDFGIKPSDYITRAEILSDIVKPAAQAAMLRVALSVGPDIYSIIVEAAKNGSIDEEKLKEVGIDAVLSGSEGFVEGSVSSTILLACKTGKFGAQFQDVSPNTVAILTILTIDAARNGYHLAKGDITPLDYSNMMAEETFIAIASHTTGVAVAALLPMIPFSYMAGSMAGAMLASTGYSVGKDVVMEVKDAGGIGTILPADMKGFNVGKDVVASLDLKEKLSGLKNLNILTEKNGTIVVSKASS